MSLTAQAGIGELPPHQAMDKETLDWIVAHNPFLDSEPSKHLIRYSSLKALSVFRPKEAWFLNNKVISGIHGLRHLLRVSN